MPSRTETRGEAALEPALPIIDAHHHLWRRPQPNLPPDPTSAHPYDRVLSRAHTYLVDDYIADVAGSGHNVRASVFMQCRAMYRADGPEHLKPLGETEFVNGMAAMGASGAWGDVRPCAGIVGFADLSRPAREVADLLDRHLATAESRFKGIRQMGAYDPDLGVLGPHQAPAGLYGSAAFRRGFELLAARGLSFDAMVVEPQLAEVADLARAYPDAPIILDHVGAPLGYASYAGRRDARYPEWLAAIKTLAALPNVTVKLGGLGMHLTNFPSLLAEPPVGSRRLADDWRPYIEAAAEAFGPGRAMFESNFPVDSGSGVYGVVWNAFKRIAANWSQAEKASAFHDTAKRVYRL